MSRKIGAAYLLCSLAMPYLISRVGLLSGDSLRFVLTASVASAIPFVLADLWLGQHKSWRMSQRTSHRFKWTSAIVAVVVVVLFFGFRDEMQFVSTVGIVVLVAAAAEEYVFRRSVPLAVENALVNMRCASTWRHGIAIVVSQAAFALCHFMPHGARPISINALSHFFAVGVLLSVVACRAGLVSAVLVHAVFNLRILSGQTPHVGLMMWHKWVIAAIGLLVVISAHGASRGQGSLDNRSRVAA